MPTYHSQFEEDRILNETVFEGMRGGVFVDIGAYDGIFFSNTLMFERDLGWTGLCIEPNPPIFRQLVSNRSSQCLNLAIAKDERTLPFISVKGYETFSGLVHEMDPRHRALIDLRLREHGGDLATFNVPARPLARILSEHLLSEIHYLSLDTEGSEAEILSTIDFDAVNIHVATIEANYNEPRDKIDSLLHTRFILAGQHHNDFYFINRRSPFLANMRQLKAVLSRPYSSYRVRKARRYAGRIVRAFYPQFRRG